MTRILHVLGITLIALHVQAQQVRIKLNAHAVLLLERARFDAAGKALIYDSKQANASLLTIAGKPIFGTDGELPKYTLRKAVLLLDGHPYQLAVDNMYNPWFGEGSTSGPSREAARLVKKKNAYQLQAVFSDGAGSYLAEWLISSSSAKRITLTADDEAVTQYYLTSSK